MRLSSPDMDSPEASEVEECRRLATAWAPVLRALGNGERLLIVLWLAGGSRSVRELEHVTGLAQSLVSYHLAQLRSAGLVTSSPHGRSNHYRLRSAELDQVATLIGTIAPQLPVTNDAAD